MKPSARLFIVEDENGGFFGDGRCELLKAVMEHGSLSAAAEALGRGYRKAWADIRKAEEATGRTSRERIWAGGDVVTGAATVILAMGAGRKAAAAIERAARLAAVLKGLGYRGMHIGGIHRRFDAVGLILDRLAKIQDDGAVVTMSTASGGLEIGWGNGRSHQGAR